EEPERPWARIPDLVRLMLSDVDDVAGRDRMPLVAEPDDAASVQDQDAMVVRVVVERGAPARGDLEIAEREVRGALGGPDQDLLRDGGAGRRQRSEEHTSELQ